MTRANDGIDEKERTAGGWRLLPVDLGRIMKAARHLALLPLAARVVIVVWMLTAPLGFAGLADQTWLGGLWDGAAAADDTLLVPIWFTPPPLHAAVVAATVSPNQTRAPPALQRRSLHGRGLRGTQTEASL